MKTAVITGGSGSIGEALVKEFAPDHRVVFTYLNSREKAEEIAGKYGAETVCCDITDNEQIQGLLNITDRCDVLINNAGISSIKLFTDMTATELKHVTDVDLIGSMMVARVFLPMMLRRNGGCVINISSVWGVFGASCEAVYSAAKAGLIGFTKALAKETGPGGVRVNAIAPGVIEGRMNAVFTPEEIQDLKDRTPLGRIGRGEDVAKAARFLAEADFVTGQILGVDGGFC